MTRSTVLCKARSMPRQIPLDVCVPNPVHPACKQCNSPKIDQMKPEERARLKSQDEAGFTEAEDLFDEPGGYEPGEDDFEEFKED